MAETLLDYQHELEEKMEPILCFSAEPISDDERSLLTACNVLLLTGMTRQQLLELRDVAEKYAKEYADGADEAVREALVNVFVEGFVLARYLQ